MPPIRLSSNPHYLEFREQTRLLISSAEHYGAVLNGTFDYLTYLDTLQRHGFNLTRVWSGAYRELQGDFGIVDNMMAPTPEQYITPWTTVQVDGDAKYDLAQWNPAYFARLKDMIREADQRGIVVEFTFFCHWYAEHFWEASPLHPKNNINGTELVAARDVYLPTHPKLMEVMTALVRKIAVELNACDNVYYEICNEPYSLLDGTAFEEWSNAMVDVLVEVEAALPQQHLIAYNAHNKTMRVKHLHPAISIINFHYAEPSAVAFNYHLNRVIGDDETGCKGQSSTPYRKEAWQFITTGGGIFNHLDLTFTPTHPDGTMDLENSPGFGGPEWRAQLAVLARFMKRFDLTHMEPHPEISLFNNAFGLEVSVLAEEGQAYAIYIFGGGPACQLKFNLPGGAYEAEWINPSTGRRFKSETFSHEGGAYPFNSPGYGEDAALSIRRIG